MDLHDPGRGVVAIGEDPGLGTDEAVGRYSEVVEGEAEQPCRFALARRDQHVDLACGADARDLGRQVEQFVRLVAHGRDGYHHLRALTQGLRDARGDRAQMFGVTNRGAAKLLDRQTR
jgi:hypothetical protein